MRLIGFYREGADEVIFKLQGKPNENLKDHKETYLGSSKFSQVIGGWDIKGSRVKIGCIEKAVYSINFCGEEFGCFGPSALLYWSWNAKCGEEVHYFLQVSLQGLQGGGCGKKHLPLPPTPFCRPVRHCNCRC